MTLAWSGLNTTPLELTPQVFTPSQKGSIQPALIGAARRHGRVAYVVSGPEALVQEIAAGHPVIVLQNLGLSWYPVWHYAVAIGYAFNPDTLVLHSGKELAKRMSLSTFNRTWARSEYWGMLTLPPDRMPATATENAYVAAVAGLEKTRHWKAALTGYRTALERWPASFPAGVGLGNAYYALGDLSSAEDALRDVVRNFPENGAAFNNLAQVLWEQGRLAEARQAAREAVRLGGSMLPVFRQTLNDIETAMGQP
jgi:predicted Zn-dependent protease